MVIVARETPLNLIHLKNMQAVTEAGAVIMPFTPAFYTRDTSLEAMMRHFTGRLLDQFRIEHHLCKRMARRSIGQVNFAMIQKRL